MLKKTKVIILKRVKRNYCQISNGIIKIKNRY